MPEHNIQYFLNLEDKKFHDYMEKISTDPKSGVLIYIAEKSMDLIEQIQKISKAKNVIIAGAVFPGLIVDNRICNEGFILFPYDIFPRYRIIKEISENTDDKVDALVEFLDPYLEHTQPETLFLLFDGGLPNVERFLSSLYLEIADELEYFGSCCGSETNQLEVCIFDNELLEKDAGLAMVLPYKTNPILEHGYSSLNKMISVASVEGNKINTLEWKPAFSAYSELVNEIFGEEIDKENVFADAVHYPLGINRIDGDCLVRIPTMSDGENSLFCAGEIPENSILTLMKGIEPGDTTAVETIVSWYKNSIKSHLHVFYCVGRRLHLGKGAEEEISLLSNKIKPNRLFGALSTGEIGNAKQGGYPLLQNATILCSSWE